MCKGLSPWITCFFTISLLGHFGSLLLVARVFRRFLVILPAAIFWPGEGYVGRKVKKKAWALPHVIFGAYVENVIEESLREMKCSLSD